MDELHLLREAGVIGLAVLTLAGIVCSAWRWRERARPTMERIEALLPQTQCRQCGFAGCRPYAEALARGSADIDRCPPGGERVIRKLASITGRPVRPLDTTRGEHKAPQLALIDEARCIGCTLCIQACPVDAIVGAPKLMHTVIADHCTGCELCLPPCPVDCIDLVAASRRLTSLLPGQRQRDARAARMRFEQRVQRLERERLDRAARLAEKAHERQATLAVESDPASARKRAIVAAALARARAKLASGR